MVGSSKILTVSYGTFSCTLEGFDDPFSTMRSIAEYFRDLAADDRYFGAEPPTPDAEMLHRIAQREVQRRVEARVSETGIVLSQSDDAAADTAPAPSEALLARRAAAADHSTAPAVGGTVDKLDRIRAVVERARSRPASTSAWRAPSERVTQQRADDSDTEDEPADILMPFGDYHGDEAGLGAIEAGDDAAEAYLPTEPEDEVEATTESAEESFEDDDAAAEVPAYEDETPDRFEAIASDESEPTEDLSDEIEPAFEEPADDDISVAAAFDEEPEPDAEPMIAGTGDAPADDAERAESVHAFDMDDDTDADEAPSPVAERDMDDDESLAERIIRLSRAGEASELISDDDPENAGTAHAPIDTGLRGEPAERRDSRPGRGHVLIGRDPDREPAFKRILEETNSKMADREGTRRRSAIAHLKAAVQATKADRMLKRERSRQVDAEEQSAYRDDLAKVVRPHASEPAEIAAARIVAQSRSEDSEPSPLVLMSSQRVDPARAMADTRSDMAEAGDTDGSDIDDMYTDDYEAFAEFAAEAGATDITDLLEAAAAFTAFVGDQPHFSRPQIMRLAAAASRDEDFTREAGLRSFGQLLRQGRIQKLQRGQFAVSGSTRFRPGARIAGE